MALRPGEGLSRGVWHVTREFAGLAEAGGLKDAVAGLAAAQVRAGIRAAVVLPRYGFLAGLKAERLPLRWKLKLPEANEASALAPETVEVHRVWRDGVEVFLLDSARARAKRDVYTYTAADELENPYQKKGTGHWDAHHLNLTLQRGALELARRARRLGWRGPPAILHCHDGHAAFLPAILRLRQKSQAGLRRIRALLTVHNAGSGYHQEIYGLEFAAQLTGLPTEVLRGGLHGQAAAAVDPLLVGPRYAPVNTVSEQYAAEIVSGELDRLTGGLGRAYREAGIHLSGITNGIDPAPYDPRFPEQTGLDYAFDPERGELEGKRLCRRRVAQETAAAASAAGPSYLRLARRGQPRHFAAGSPLAGLGCYGSLADTPGTPLFTFVGRLASQKGVDILGRSHARLLNRKADLSFLVLGQGERELEERLAGIAGGPAATGKFCLLVGFNSLAAKYCYAAGDYFLVPSLYEPCGLTDLYAQMMGNLPIVHRVGGLIKVRQGETGYSYEEHSVQALCGAIEEAARDRRLQPERLEGMRRLAFREVLERFTWDRVLERGYLPLYREILASA